MALTGYIWIPITCSIFAFIASLGMGGNDVANSFATSVGAKALTLKSTIIIASICEFSGAMLLGSYVTETIKGGIVVGELFKDHPAELMYGMLTVVFGCAIWLVVATLWALPVSSTHTCIGGMLGMALVSKGVKAVHWKVVINVICSWFYTPCIAGLIAFTLFYFVRKYILLTDNSFNRSLSFFAPMIGVTLALNFFVLINGCPWIPFKLAIWQDALISIIAAIIVAICIYYFMLPWVRRKAEDAEKQKNQEDLAQSLLTAEEGATENPATQPAEAAEPVKAAAGSDEHEKQDVFASLKEDGKVAEIHEKAEVYDIKSEKVFVNLQVLAAVLNSIAHGANDVSHSIGPFAACIAIYQTGLVNDTSPTPAYILAFGAIGIIVGLATMGYKVMATVGVNLVTVTPCRGFFIELGASLVVIVGSRLGLPLSTTQCKIGAAVGVGLVGGAESVNWKLFLKIFAGWVVTILIAGILSAILMVIGVHILKFE